MSSFEPDYTVALTDLKQLLACAFEFSVRLTGASDENDSRKRIASIYFAKINLCGLSITKLLPKDPKTAVVAHDSTTEPEGFCDISSVASLCRNLIEASNRLFYFAIEQVSDTEAAMRLKINEYHAVCGHQAILKYLRADEQLLRKLDIERAKLKSELEQSVEFQALNKNAKKKILEGKQGEALSQPAIAVKRGHTEGSFRADYKYLSSHIHSDGFSLMDLAKDKVGGLMNDAIRERLTGMAREASQYLALTIKEMNALFPKFRMSSQGEESIRSITARLQMRS